MSHHLNYFLHQLMTIQWQVYQYLYLHQFEEHKELVNSALSTAQDLHGLLVASLRNNENEVALTLIGAIELNKETELASFNSTLKIFNDNYSKILENIEILP